ncbi:MAG: low specificity L-threonine aldolase [Rubrobacteraceae bacterium]|nr:low specificity L-threonine aldolase [Rubrobacteraceae bacterium]
MSIDLRSDTITLPDDQMRAVMREAETGDDCYGEDPSVSCLEQYCADLFGKEEALFISTGTLSNQIAIRCHTRPGDEVILDASYHIYFFESAQTADLARVTLNPCFTEDGIITEAHIEGAINLKPRSAAYAVPKLVCTENTINARGGRIFPVERLRSLYFFAKERDLSVHLDGARIMNACVATGVPPRAYAAYTDSLSMCFAKGLGAPFGSILVGDSSFIRDARKYRKWYGGALHQSGVLAAAALYALQNNVSRLAEDHANARLLAELLAELPGIEANPDEVETNMVMADISTLGLSSVEFCEEASKDGVLLFPWTPEIVRATTHLGIEERDVRDVVRRLRHAVSRLSGRKTAHVSP